MLSDESAKRGCAELAGLVLIFGIAVGCNTPLRAARSGADGAAPTADGADVSRTTGELTVIAGKPGGAGDTDGIGTAARFRSAFALAKDGAGRIFVTDFESGVIRQIDAATGAVRTLAGAPGFFGSSDGVGAAARFNHPAGIAADGAGNLFVADSENNTIRKIAVATGTVTTFAGLAGSEGSSDGIGQAARFFRPTGVACDGAGMLFVADAENHTIRRIAIATGAVTTVAGSAGISGHTDGKGAAARFTAPSAVSADGSGRVFVADTRNCLIRTVDAATGDVTTMAGGFVGAVPPGITVPVGFCRGGYADGIGDAARFAEPTGITADGAGNLLVAERFNGAIRKIVIGTRLVTTLAKANGATGVLYDGVGNLFVASGYDHTVERVVLSTGEVSTFAGSTESSGYVDGSKDGVRFSWLRGLAGDADGNLFIAQGNNLRKLEVASGTVTTVAGFANSFSGDSLVSDGAGHLYAAENETIRRIDLASGLVTTIAGLPGETGSSDGIGSTARFQGPGAMAWDGVGGLFVADIGSFTIRKVDVATGTVTTLAGRARAGAYLDGTGDQAFFSRLGGLAYDDAGALFAADAGNNVVRKIEVASGKVTTLAGRYTSDPLTGIMTSSGSIDGMGANASFDGPTGIVYDKKGNLFVGDVNSHTIRKIVIATSAVTTVAGIPGRMGVVTGPLPAGLSNPVALAMGPAGQLLVADAAENAVLAVTF